MPLQPNTPIPILLRDVAWRTAIERFRSLDARWRMVPCRDWTELRQIIGTYPWSFSVVEVGVGETALWVRRIGFLGRLGALHRVAVVGSRELSPAVGLLLEAGAVHCAISIAESPRVARLIERFTAAYPPSNLTLRESIYDALPWSDVAIAVPSNGSAAAAATENDSPLS